MVSSSFPNSAVYSRFWQTVLPGHPESNLPEAITSCNKRTRRHAGACLPGTAPPSPNSRLRVANTILTHEGNNSVDRRY